MQNITNYVKIINNSILTYFNERKQRMELKMIKTKEEYKKAVNYLEKLGDSPDFESNPKLIEKFELIEKLIELYDNEHYTIGKGNPVEVIKLKMEYMQLKPKDLIQAIGSKGLVSEVLNKKRKLSKRMIRELSKLLNISQEILNTEYELSLTKCKDLADDIMDTEKRNFNLPKSLLTIIENYSNAIFQRKSILNIISV